MASLPKLRDYFEIHEGVHSGNIRSELFVEKKEDDTCKRLLFGRNEISPYSLQWNGKYIRLGAIPSKKTKKRYANAGRPEWYSQPKLLVRRTGDFVLAAVDWKKRYASNNFFVVFPKAECELSLNGLCALLNSKVMTWYFRTIEPRKGRVFSELKIKHIREFPLPREDSVTTLNQLGEQRADFAKKLVGLRLSVEKEKHTRLCGFLDKEIDQEVVSLLGLEKIEKILNPQS